MVEHAVDEDLQPAHRAGGQIVQHEQRPRLRQALRDGGFGPAARVLPVARDRVPQHAGHLFLLQHFDRRRVEQMRSELAAAAERAKQQIRMRQFIDRRLRIDDLGDDARRIAHAAERLRVAPGVIADPVALGMRALRDATPLGVGELGAEHEEGRFDVRGAEDVQHARRDGRFRAVVEGEGYIHFKSGTDHVISPGEKWGLSLFRRLSRVS